MISTKVNLPEHKKRSLPDTLEVESVELVQNEREFVLHDGPYNGRTAKVLVSEKVTTLGAFTGNIWHTVEYVYRLNGRVAIELPILDGNCRAVYTASDHGFAQFIGYRNTKPKLIR